MEPLEDLPKKSSKAKKSLAILAIFILVIAGASLLDNSLQNSQNRTEDTNTNTSTGEPNTTTNVQGARTQTPAQTIPVKATSTPSQTSQSSSNCDPNYSGACVPIASDVDCAGGSGNGPAYVAGPVTVVGTDIYGLDRDGDGIGCE